MSQFNREEDADGRGAGGKAPRLRRPVDAIPYPRPPPEPRGWLSTIVSGAGKLLSAVIGSESSDSGVSSCSRSDYASDDEICRFASDIEGDFVQHGNKLDLVEDWTMDHLPLASMGNSKLLIEQLIQQETFTRDECNKLVEMVQSRVIGFPMENGNCPQCRNLPSRNCNVASRNSMGLSWSYQPNWRSSDVGSKLHIVSPGDCSDHGYSRELCDQAVMEARKWIQGKRSSNSEADYSCGPCTLNTEMQQYDTESDGGSPVELAKSYMCVLPQWQSPRIVTADVQIPSAVAFHEKYESLDFVSSPFSSLRSFNGEHPCGGLLDTPNVTRDLPQPVAKIVELSSSFKQSDFPDEKDIPHFQSSFTADKKKSRMLHRNIDTFISPTSNSANMSVKLPADTVNGAISTSATGTIAKAYSRLDRELVQKPGLCDHDFGFCSKGETSNAKVVKGTCTTKEKADSPASMGVNAALVDTSYVSDAEPIAMVPVDNNALLPSRMDESGSDVAGTSHSDNDVSALDIGATLKSIKKMLRNNHPCAGNNRKKKAAGRSSRGRG